MQVPVMRTVYACSCVLLLSAALASAQSAPVKILISSKTQPASAGQEAQAIASYFENRVQELLMKKYPCAEPLTMGDVKTLLEFDRQRNLLDSNYEGGLQTIADAMGANYYISLTVTPLGSGQVALNASMMNAANAQAVAKTGSTTAGGSAALKGVDALAQQLVQGMSGLSRLSKGCGGVWSGTIVYRKTSALDENTASSADEVNRIHIKREYEATVTLSASVPKNVKASVKSSLSQSREWITSNSVNCAKRPGFDEPVLKVLKRERIENESASVDGTVDAVAEVTVTNDQARISLKVPAVEGGTMVGKKKVSDGLCEGPIVQDIPDISVPWASDEESGEVTVKLDPRNPDELSGTRDLGGATIQWALSRSKR